MGDGFPALYEAWWVQNARGLVGGTEEFCPLCASAQASPVATGILSICSPDRFSTSGRPPRPRPGQAWLSSNPTRHGSRLWSAQGDAAGCVVSPGNPG